MVVAADDEVDAVLSGQLMKRKFAALEFQRYQPERLVKENEFRSAIPILQEIAFQKLHLPGGEVETATVVENGEMRVLEVEAVGRSMSGLFFENTPGSFRPDVVIAGGQKERDLEAIPSAPQ